MSVRISANVSPLQSPNSAIILSIRSDALIWADDVAPAFFAIFADFFAVFFLAAASFIVLPAIVFTPLTARSRARRHGLQAAPEEVREPPEHASARRETPRLRAIAY
jgi:hypothetical protein